MLFIRVSIFTHLEFFVWVLLSIFYKSRTVIFLQMYSFLGLKVMGFFSLFSVASIHLLCTLSGLQLLFFLFLL